MKVKFCRDGVIKFCAETWEEYYAYKWWHKEYLLKTDDPDSYFILTCPDDDE